MESIELERAPEPVHFDSRPIETSEMNVPVHSSWWSRLEDKWNRIQVGRQGSYSIERLVSLEAYCKTTSRTRVFLVCLLNPLPALLTAVLVECMPLRPPSEGIAANWVFWLRLLVVEFVLVFIMTAQMSKFLPDLQLTICKVLAIACGVSVPLVGLFLLAGNMIGFPVPFMLGMSPIAILASTMHRLVLDPGLFVKGSPLQLQLKRFQRFFFAFLAVCTAYPMYIVLFNMIPEVYQGIAVIIVPIWKFASRHFLMRAARELEDSIPAIVSLTVDLTCALFVSTAAGSVYISLLFIAADFTQALLELREVGTNAHTLLQLLDGQTKHHVAGQANAPSTNLLSIILHNTRDSVSFGVNSLKGVRLRASIPLSLTSKQVTQLQVLESSGSFGWQEQRSVFRKNNTRTPLKARALQRGLVTPKALINTPSSVRVISQECGLHERNTTLNNRNVSTKIVVQSLQLLFHCEYLALVEYVECVVPLVFVIFKSILKQLPNIVYFPGVSDNWSVEIARRVLLVVALEFGSLLLFNTLFQRRFAISPFYQLAFVLETDIYPIQPILFCAFLNVLQYDLVHFGADFSLRLEWLKDKRH